MILFLILVMHDTSGKISERSPLAKSRHWLCTIFTTKIKHLSVAPLPLINSITISRTSSKFKVLAVDIREDRSTWSDSTNVDRLTHIRMSHLKSRVSYLNSS